MGLISLVYLVYVVGLIRLIWLRERVALPLTMDDLKTSRYLFAKYPDDDLMITESP